jgi:hypothetical protein
MKPKTIGRWINLLFWLGVWYGVVRWTNVSGDWVSIIAEGIVVAVPWLFIHIAFRTETPGNEAPHQ